MLRTTGHQTISKTSESHTERSKIGPVFSSYYEPGSRKRKEHPPFAGPGYYFWDDNLNAAHWWGQTHYKGRYRIFTIDLELDHNSGDFIDLVGSRAHMQLLVHLIEKTKKILGEKCRDWKLYNFIHHFRHELNKKVPGIFNFKIIRFNDINTGSLAEKEEVILSSRRRNYQNKIILNPFYIICIFDKKDVSHKPFVNIY